jgi:threonyl-tRNA synthetase
MEIDTIRHSLAHILAAAVQELYPGVKFGIGPAIENGFYYDFDLSNPLSPADLPKIEKRMKQLIRENIKFEKKIVSRAECKKLFKNQPYKLELIKELKKITIYQSGNFVDLCKGPHIKTTKEINPDSFKLTRIAGAYWKGDEKNKMLTRVYGIAFETKKQLSEYIKQQEEAEKRDHRVLGKKLDLFLFDEEVGAGLPIWLPNGATLRKIIEDYLYKELTKQGYGWLVTPHIGNLNLWKTSGHWNFYKENLYSPIQIDEEQYLIKPMNCPFHIKAYQNTLKSWRDLPIKYAELGTVYRYEKSGVLHGLTRVRGFTQDDAHIFCSKNQLSEELLKLVKYAIEILKKFGFTDYNIYLSTRPKKYVGSLKNWQKSTNSLKFALDKLKLKYEIDPGEGVFYGPKIDIKIKDSLGRDWQCTTIQVDFNLPEKFKVNYINEKGKKEQPIMIHRAILGSMERFIGILIEQYAGAFPLWLSPVQVYVLPISDKHSKYAKKITQELIENDFRETIGKKIREGETQKIPYLIIVGDKEQKAKTINIRARGNRNIGEVKLDKFIEKLAKEIKTRS